MKDIKSSLGGSTLPSPEGEVGKVKGVVVRNKGEYGRRIGIFTNEAEIKAGPSVHAADYAFDPQVPASIPEGYTAGVEVELSAERTYLKALEFLVPLNNNIHDVLDQAGRSDLVGYKEMSNKVAGWSALTEKLGQTITTSELRLLDVDLGAYFFGLSLSNKGHVYHLGFDCLKHPARLTADLNYQMRKVMPGASGYFEFLGDGENNNGILCRRLALYLSTTVTQGNISIFAYRVPNYTKAILDRELETYNMHINNEINVHYVVTPTEVTQVDPAGEYVTSYRDEVIPTITDLFADRVSMMNPGVFRDDGNYYTWEPVVSASKFKTYAPDPRFRIAILELNYPMSMPRTTLKLGAVKYKLISGERQADLMVLKGQLTDQVLGTVKNPVCVFNQIDVDDTFILNEVLNSPERTFEFGELAGQTQTVMDGESWSQPKFYVAVIAPPQDLNTVPLFRNGEDVTLSIRLDKVNYQDHVLNINPEITVNWDDVYNVLDTTFVQFPNLTGTFASDAALKYFDFKMNIANPAIRSVPTVVGNEVNPNISLLFSEMIQELGYPDTFQFDGVLGSVYTKPTAVIGFETFTALQLNMTYPATNIGLSALDIHYAKENPNVDLGTPLMVSGNILGGFAGAPLKHASLVQWEFSIDGGETFVPMDVAGVPTKGSLTDSFTLGLDKAVLETLDVNPHFLRVRLTVQWPWKAWSEIPNTVITKDIPITVTIWTPEELPPTASQTEISVTVPYDVTGIEFYDPDTNEVIIAVEDIESLFVGGEVLAPVNAAGIYLDLVSRSLNTTPEPA